MWLGDLPTKGLSILVSSLETDPQLDTIGLRGVSGLCVLELNQLASL